MIFVKKKQKLINFCYFLNSDIKFVTFRHKFYKLIQINNLELLKFKLNELNLFYDYQKKLELLKINKSQFILEWTHRLQFNL